MTNHQMLGELYLEAQPRWIGIAKKILPRRSDQEDAVQIGFAKSLKRQEPFGSPLYAKRYLSFPVYHAAIDLARKAQRFENFARAAQGELAVDV